VRPWIAPVYVSHVALGSQGFRKSLFVVGIPPS
jgi:hypothetical protein